MAEPVLQVSDEKKAMEPGPSPEDVDYKKWQGRLLPFMTRMVVILTFFFFFASCGQLIYLHWNILKGPKLNTHESLSLLSLSSDPKPEEILEASKLKAIIMLEANSLENQYHQASILLMSRVWTSYLGFVTGMILALVGAAFILGKLREPTSELITKLQATDISFKSASPGLVLAVLGTILMLTTVITHHNIEVVHTAVYLRDSQPKTSFVNSEQPILEHPKPKAERMQ